MWAHLKPLLILVVWTVACGSLGWHVSSYKEHVGVGILMFLVTVLAMVIGATFRVMTYR